MFVFIVGVVTVGEVGVRSRFCIFIKVTPATAHTCMALCNWVVCGQQYYHWCSAPLFSICVATRTVTLHFLLWRKSTTICNSQQCGVRSPIRNLSPVIVLDPVKIRYVMIEGLLLPENEPTQIWIRSPTLVWMFATLNDASVVCGVLRSGTLLCG